MGTVRRSEERFTATLDGTPQSRGMHRNIALEVMTRSFLDLKRDVEEMASRQKAYEVSAARQALVQSKAILAGFEDELATQSDVYVMEVVTALVRSLNDVIFNADRSRDRAGPILTINQKEALQRHKKPYITDILRWNPTTVVNIQLKEAALACLSPSQQIILDSFTDPAVRNALSTTRTARNKSQHPQPSKASAKYVISGIPGIDPSVLALAREWIDVSGEPISGRSSFFLDEDDKFTKLANRTEIMRENVAELEKRLAAWDEPV
ncbi:hypothetical protein DFH09DRAFT_1131893 [Mycena vulgaris]|nr:hypothetical protein DFH09DRAFT_1131893 [Mycena vulgaris]